jgi:hypothetical protein
MFFAELRDKFIAGKDECHIVDVVLHAAAMEPPRVPAAEPGFLESFADGRFRHQARERAVIVIRAAGIVFMSDQGRVLLMRRVPEGDWDYPGGKCREDETAEHDTVPAIINRVTECQAQIFVTESLLSQMQNANSARTACPALSC